MIDLVASAPVAIEASAGITEAAWYRTAAAGGTGESGAVFDRAAAEPETPARVSSRLSEPLVRKLCSLLRLERGWDSYDAGTVSPRAIETALAFLAQMVGRPRPSIVPTTRGGIQLEWHDGRIDVEIECLPNGYGQLAAGDSESGESVERWVVPGHIAIDQWLDKLDAQAEPAAQ